MLALLLIAQVYMSDRFLGTRDYTRCQSSLLMQAHSPDQPEKHASKWPDDNKRVPHLLTYRFPCFVYYSLTHKLWELIRTSWRGSKSH